MTKLTAEFFTSMSDHYLNARQLPDGRWIVLEQLMFGQMRLQVGCDEHGWSEAYDFRNRLKAVWAFDKWQGEGEPVDWLAYRGPGGVKLKGPDWRDGEEF